MFRSNKTNGSTDKSSLGGALDKRYPETRVPTVAEVEDGSLTERVALVGGSGKEDSRSETGCCRPKRSSLPKRELVKEIEAVKLMIE